MAALSEALNAEADRNKPYGRLLLAGALLVLVANSFMLFISLNRLTEATAWVKHTYNARQIMAQVLADVMQAEAMQRTYLITGNPSNLQVYGTAVDSARSLTETLSAILDDNPEQQSRIEEIGALIDTRFAQLETVFEERSLLGIQAAPELLRQANVGVSTGGIRQLLQDAATVEDDLLEARQRVHAESQMAAFVSMAIFIGTTLGFIIAAVWMRNREVASRRLFQQQIRASATELDENVKLLKHERNEVALINEMSSFLQSSSSLEEVSMLAAPFLERLFPEHAGVFRVYAASRNQLTIVAAWGASDIAAIMLPDECWGLRRGQTHVHNPENGGPACPHCVVDGKLPGDTICVPLQAFGDTIGLLSLQWVDGSSARPQIDNTLRLAVMVGRQLSLTLANLNLRRTLNDQSIRDPLTNAFNRRYLEVLAAKEIAQAARHSRSVAVVMLDIDHFKQFNDVHGHRAGDSPLVSVVNYLHANIREGDWLFRYGGEEFLLLLVDANQDDILNKVEQLRAGIQGISLHLDEETLPSITASMGITFLAPSDTELASLIARADEGLYVAKREGRNCVRSVERNAA